MDTDRDQQTRDLAYQKWIDEGQPDGRAEAHWMEAEQELGGDRAAIAAETDYVMQTDDLSRSATQDLISNPEGPSDPMSGSTAPQAAGDGSPLSSENLSSPGRTGAKKINGVGAST